MCGIAGIVASDSTRIEASVLQRMGRAMRHRGPDDAGVYVDQSDGTSAGLAHRRLSIIDLSPAGHQPMSNEDGTIWLTYNGEIYNHAALRRELIARGHQYRSHTDSETIIHAYEEWGDACVERFRGMFAFGIWDSRKRRLLAARDRLGVKPFYYAVRGRSMVFASEIKAILASGCVQPAAAREAIPEYLMFGHLAGEGTMFEHIMKLPPGHVMAWEAGRVRISRYWEVKFTPDESKTEEEFQRRFAEILDESVRLRLMSDVPLGVFLSGGLDSSAIAAVMSRHVSGRLKTFSVGFEAPYYSESPFARVVARHIGAEHHEVVLTPSAFMDSLPRMIWHEDEPLWGPASVALYHVADLASKSVKVVLTGEGSDELFAGYDRYWMTELNARLAPAYGLVPRRLRDVVRRAVVHGMLPQRVRRGLSHTILNHDRMPEGLFFDNWFGVFTPEMQHRIGTTALQRTLEATDVYASHRRVFDRSRGAALVDRMLYTDINSNLVELLMKQDQMSMAASIESRVPFLDHKLVEFAASVPWRYKLGARSGKQLIKRALVDYLPDHILNRPKEGFPVPFDAWLREKYFDQAQGVLLGRSALSRGWFRPEAVKALLSDHKAGRQDSARQIWSLLGLELWAQIFLDGDVAWHEAPDEAWQESGAAAAGAAR
jgi:asparagine synthase (glutamine-hydrolysing)